MNQACYVPLRLKPPMSTGALTTPFWTIEQLIYQRETGATCSLGPSGSVAPRMHAVQVTAGHSHPLITRD